MGEDHRLVPQRSCRGFTEELKPDAVELVRSTGRPIAQIARELGIVDSTLGDWVRQDRIDRGEREGLTTDKRARLWLHFRGHRIRRPERATPTSPAGSARPCCHS